MRLDSNMPHAYKQATSTLGQHKKAQ